MRFRAILFDVAGSIDLEFAWEIAVDRAIAAACGLEGIPVEQAKIEEASERAVEAFATNTYAHIITTLCSGHLATIARVRRRVGDALEGLDVFQLRPDIDGLLRRLAGRGLKLSIVANQAAETRERLQRAGIGDLFAVHGLSGGTGLSKPDPRAFKAAVAVLGVAPSECIMVGDRLDNDIVPAKELGMATILFRTGRHRRQQPRSLADQPDAVVTDVIDLDAAITALLR